MSGVKTYEEYQKEIQEDFEKQRQDYAIKASKYKHVFNSNEGQEVLEDLTNLFNAQPSFVPGTDVNDVCYLEGQKAVINHIFTLINYKPHN